jgi:hypothetical protein
MLYATSRTKPLMPYARSATMTEKIFTSLKGGPTAPLWIPEVLGILDGTLVFSLKDTTKYFFNLQYLMNFCIQLLKNFKNFKEAITQPNSLNYLELFIY